MRPRILWTLFLPVALLIALITVFLARFSLTAETTPQTTVPAPTTGKLEVIEICMKGTGHDLSEARV